jgi:hypothetical protein
MQLALTLTLTLTALLTSDCFLAMTFLPWLGCKTDRVRRGVLAPRFCCYLLTQTLRTAAISWVVGGELRVGLSFPDSLTL